MRSKYVVGTLDQQTSQIRVAGLRDPELRVPIAGLTASRSQAEIAPDIAALLEALLAAQSQHERQSRKVAHTVDLQQRLRLRILRLTELLDLTVVPLDLGCHLCDLFDDRSKWLSQPGWHHYQASLGKVLVVDAGMR
jgi:hypothetical protein